MPYALTLTTPNGAESWPLLVPTRWADVTLAQFVALFADGGQQMSPVEILCTLPAGALERLSVQAVQQLAGLIGFATDPAPVLELLPTPGLPDIGSLPYGTLLLAQQYVASEPDKPVMAYGPYLLALYRVQMAYGKYDAGKVAACLQALLAAPVTESYGDCAFFLASFRTYTSATPPTPPMLSTPSPKRKRRAPRSWRNALARYSAWMLRRAARSSIIPAS